MTDVNLGCPRYCDGMTCVDIHPLDERVVKANVFDWLVEQNQTLDSIYTKNLLEHLPDPGAFLDLCHTALKEKGLVDVITDNAEFFPFYFPFFYMTRTGIGAHSRDEYAMSKWCNETHHYAVFTKMHLRNLFEYAGFRMIKVRRIKFGARLEAIGEKI